MKEKEVKRKSDEKEVYLLRIIRRSNNPSESLVGTIENIRGKKKCRFKTGEELIRWLTQKR